MGRLTTARRKLRAWFWGKLFGPRNKILFRIRIVIRIRWLMLRLWWSQLRPQHIWWMLPRPLFVLIIAVGAPIVSGWLAMRFWPAEAAALNRAFHTLLTAKGGEIPWREFIQLLALGLGIPAAFILWAFRDYHVQATLENQRKDVNLKAFQEIQLRAAGALDEKLPAHARQTLQIAALHQLCAFLRGEYGESFRRPAWELLRARMQTSAIETESAAIVDWVEAGGFNMGGEEESAADYAERNVAEIRAKVALLKPSPIAQAERQIVQEEYHAIFHKRLPLAQSCFDGIALKPGAPLYKSNFVQCSFVGAILRGAHLEGADLYEAHLEGANLFAAHLEGADLTAAHLEGADLRRAHLEGADLYEAHLEGADLSWAHLEGADLREAHLEGASLFAAHLEGADLREAHLEGAELFAAHLEGADLSGAHLEGADLCEAVIDDKTQLTKAKFNDATQFSARDWDEDWPSLPEAEKQAARAPWIARGAINVDAPPSVEIEPESDPA